MTKIIKTIIENESLTEQRMVQGFGWILSGFGLFLCLMIFVFTPDMIRDGMVLFAIMPVITGLTMVKIGYREEEK